eukprot:Opistho-1_new@98061
MGTRQTVPGWSTPQSTRSGYTSKPRGGTAACSTDDVCTLRRPDSSIAARSFGMAFVFDDRMAGGSFTFVRRGEPATSKSRLFGLERALLGEGEDEGTRAPLLALAFMLWPLDCEGTGLADPRRSAASSSCPRALAMGGSACLLLSECGVGVCGRPSERGVSTDDTDSPSKLGASSMSRCGRRVDEPASDDLSSAAADDVTCSPSRCSSVTVTSFSTTGTPSPSQPASPLSAGASSDRASVTTAHASVASQSRASPSQGCECSHAASGTGSLRPSIHARPSSLAKYGGIGSRRPMEAGDMRGG